MMRFAVLISLLFTFLSNAQEMRIGLFRSVKTTQMDLQVHQGQYSVYVDSVLIDTLQFGEKAKVSLHSGIVKVNINKGAFQGERIRFIQDSLYCSMSLTSITPKSRVHKYKEDFEFTSESGRLRIVNLVSMNNYLEGVIESEGGGGRHIEYYKVQTLMSRTYAIQNRGRHAKEGFELCDNVHCQAYHNMLRHSPTIHEAVTATTGEVIVDASNKPVTTYFHANCGGQTCDASYVWNTPVSYCETFVDTFCIHTRQATWTKYIDKGSWESFLAKEYGYPVNDPSYSSLLFDFKQEQRKAFYIHPQFGIPLRDLRTKFKLKSTYFDVSLEGNKVKIEGRGFGHGVGLCQEGAMEMAKQGYTYRQIAYYYFNDVFIVNLDRLQFFSQTSDWHQ